jgi:signal transduction histidine kinase
MRLADFILANTETILAEWDTFAGSTAPGVNMGRAALRDHAEAILRAAARDMGSAQTGTQQTAKSKGSGEDGEHSARLDGASAVHGVGRVGSGFDLMEMVSEYRALRASVMRLWRESKPATDLRDLDDVTRFNEAIDQSLAKAVQSYTRRVDQSRRMFLAILGHDLRNPLNSIMMSAELVSQTADAQHESGQAASQIAASAGAIARLVNDLLDFAATGLGSAMPLSPTAMDLATLCREVFTEFQAAHPTCALGAELSGALTGEWDAGRLRQVLSNLLGNAAQHGGSPCGVSISVRGDGTDVLMAVHNGGEPIPADLLPLIFDPLVRGVSQAQPPRRAGSVGLGLYIAREIVSAHGGAIGVTSSAASGTTFTVRLPRTAPRAANPAA